MTTFINWIMNFIIHTISGTFVDRTMFIWFIISSNSVNAYNISTSVHCINHLYILFEKNKNKNKNNLYDYLHKFDIRNHFLLEYLLSK